MGVDPIEGSESQASQVNEVAKNAAVEYGTFFASLTEKRLMEGLKGKEIIEALVETRNEPRILTPEERDARVKAGIAQLRLELQGENEEKRAITELLALGRALADSEPELEDAVVSAGKGPESPLPSLPGRVQTPRGQEIQGPLITSPAGTKPESPLPSLPERPQGLESPRTPRESTVIERVKAFIGSLMTRLASFWSLLKFSVEEQFDGLKRFFTRT
ncbi:MAG: hypothetical protein WAM28_02825 [Chlamydiales bacterium]